MQKFKVVYFNSLTGTMQLSKVRGESLEAVMAAELEVEARMQAFTPDFKLISVKPA